MSTIQHLKNIRIFSDYKKSGYDSFQKYVDSVENNHAISYKDEDDYLINHEKDENERKNLIFEYGSLFNYHYAKELSFFDEVVRIDPNTQDIKKLFQNDEDLFEYLETDLALVDQYISLSTRFTTNNFFQDLKEYEKTNSYNNEKVRIKEAVEDKLTLKQIALLYIYQSKRVSSFNADEIAKEHGHSSGQKLTEHFSNLKDDNNRVRGNSKRADSSLVTDIKKILPLLEESHKQKAESDIEKLEDNLLSY